MNTETSWTYRGLTCLLTKTHAETNGYVEVGDTFIPVIRKDGIVSIDEVSDTIESKADDIISAAESESVDEDDGLILPDYSPDIDPISDPYPDEDDGIAPHDKFIW